MKKSKRRKKSNSWRIKQHRDQFFKKSKTLGFRSRAAFKLIELNKKFNFIKKNTNLLDIGSSPGGWAQVSRKICTTGKVMSLDLVDMEKIENVVFYRGNFLEQKTKNKIMSFFDKNIDVIISDMAANTTGNKTLDCIRTNQLCADVMVFSHEILKPNGVLVSKIFMGEDVIEIKELARSKFKKVQFFKPESSKNESKETYVHCATLRTL